MVNPKIFIKIKAENSEVGIARSTINEFFILCKNKNNTIATSKIAKPKSLPTSFKESLVKVVIS